MSRRKIKRDTSEVRKLAYKSIDDNEVQEAMWEAMQLIKEQGIDVGEKANAVLKQRAEIKARLKKPDK
jgi:hypothetical protein